MNKNKYDIIEVAEDLAKTGYSIGSFACKYFYKVSSLEVLNDSMDAYKLSRFKQRLEYFTHEHENISNKEKEDFYSDLKNNTQNLDYLYEFIEKTRTSTYDIHAKILSKLSVSLIKRKGLNYYESSLVSNLSTLNEDDFLIFYFAVLNNKTLTFELQDNKTNTDIIAMTKFANIGFLNKKEDTKYIKFIPTHYVEVFHNILEEILD